MVIHDVDTIDPVRLADDTESDHSMSDLVEFLKARLDEDEQIARTSIGKYPERAEWSYEPWSPRAGWGSGEVIAPNDRDSTGYPEMITCDREGVQQSVEENDGPHIARHNPARVLREVEAKRKIVEEHQIGHDPCDAHDAAMESVPCGTICALASVYSDHPDYREEWAQ